MDLLQAIDVRRSRRKYLTTPLPESTVTALRDLITRLDESDGVGASRHGRGRLELVTDNGAAFDGLRRSYGMFTGVRHYVGLIADRRDPDSFEKLGYDGEIVNLTAVALGLGTCVVGGSFDRGACPFALSKDETVVCVIVVGQVDDAMSVRENLVRGAMHRRSKTMEQMTDATPPWPDWFRDGLAAARKAPSAANRQPVKFSLTDGVATAATPASNDPLMPVDLGIAKLHFALGAGGGTWQWGSGGAFAGAPAARESSQ